MEQEGKKKGTRREQEGNKKGTRREQEGNKKVHAPGATIHAPGAKPMAKSMPQASISILKSMPQGTRREQEAVTYTPLALQTINRICTTRAAAGIKKKTSR